MSTAYPRRRYCVKGGLFADGHAPKPVKPKPVVTMSDERRAEIERIATAIAIVAVNEARHAAARAKNGGRQ